jgi:hypothetical protein
MATMMMHLTLSRRISYRVLLTTTPGRLGIEWMERANTDRSIAWAMERANTDRSIAWARQSYAQMEPFFASGRYVNYLGDDETGDPVAMAYGPNYRRLQEIKSKYDPNNFFHMNPKYSPVVLS